MITELLEKYRMFEIDMQAERNSLSLKLQEIVENNTEEGKYYQMVDKEQNLSVFLRPFYKQYEDTEEWVKVYDVIKINGSSKSSLKKHGNSYITILQYEGTRFIESHIVGELELISESYYNEILQTIKKLDI